MISASTRGVGTPAARSSRSTSWTESRGMTTLSLQADMWFLRRCCFERLPSLLGGEGVGELVQVPLDDAVEPLDRQADPVVRHAVVGIVVGPDLLGALAPADLGAACSRELFLLPLALELEQAGAQNAKRLRLVLELRLLVLHRDDQPRRHVCDADRGVGRVHALAPRARRAVDVDLELVGVDLHL